MTRHGTGPRGLAWPLLATAVAVLVAFAAWRGAAMLLDATGLEPLRPLAPVLAIALALTALQAAWDRIEAIVLSTSRRGRP
ncbi:hypothetical protein [uncultured Alsobacter sp.]|uniref:hypothetical protein n=1 Tax=uncultured Alsobacter sp. TaxID=1748258 RepID=UPI0025E5094C|nr:hypothetical protein [uncultured Alsobacter sp.]